LQTLITVRVTGPAWAEAPTGYVQAQTPLLLTQIFFTTISSSNDRHLAIHEVEN